MNPNFESYIGPHSFRCNLTVFGKDLTVFGKISKSKNSSLLFPFPKTRKPWPGFGPGTFALPRRSNGRLDNDSKPTQDVHSGVATISNDLTIRDEDFTSWDKFQEYAYSRLTSHTAKCRVLYAKRYLYVLRDCNAQDLLLLSEHKRLHVMKSLATLAKFHGCYNRWKEIRERYQLKWSGHDGLQTFKEITNPRNDFESMISWLKNAIGRLPEKYGNVLLFNTLTGLRPDEACKSITLIHNDLDRYLNRGLLVLEHFRYPDLFIRRTKKAYISVVSKRILDIATNCSISGYNSLRLAVKRRGLDMNMAYCRKIFATHLRMNQVESETIDLLQGRAPDSVFARHYFRPGSVNHTKVIPHMNSLCDILTRFGNT